MNNRILLGTFAVLMGLGIWASLPTQAEDKKVGQPAESAKVSEHHASIRACAKTCANCQIHCDMCYAHCNAKTAMGIKGHDATAQLCVDCAECCKLAATLTARGSNLSMEACDCCAKCCDKCADACEKMADDSHMKACAVSCRECAKACRVMMQHVGK